MKRWRRFGLLASVIWIAGGGLLAFRGETWIVAWRFYCSVTADAACVNATVFLVARWEASAGIVLIPLILTWLIAWAMFAIMRRIRRSGLGV